MPRLLSDAEVMALPPRRLLTDDDLAGELGPQPEPSLRELNLRHGAPIPPTVNPGRRTATDVEVTVHPRLLEAGRSATTDLLTQSAAGGAGAVIGGPLARMAGSGLRWLGRGLRTRAAVGFDAASRAAAVPPSGTSLVKGIGKELANAAAVGTAIDLAPEFTPGDDIASEESEGAVALGGALASLAVGQRRLLLQHPGFRAWATGAAKGHAGLGALLGIALTSAPAVNDAIQEFIAQFEGEDEAPAPQTSASQAATPPQWRPMPGGVGPPAPQPDTIKRAGDHPGPAAAL